MSRHKFGFISDEIVEGLQTYGNWKIRQNAIETLLKTIEGVILGPEVIAAMPQFIDFLFTLLDDPNFKIKQGSLETINALIKKLGLETENYLKNFIGNLVDRLSDPKVYVKEGCLAAFKEILEIIGPVRFLLALKHTPSAETVVIREEVILLHLMVAVELPSLFKCCFEVLLSAESPQKLDHFVVTLAFDALKDALLDTSGRVASCAIEGLVFLKGHLSSQEFRALLSDGNKLTDARRTEVEACLENKTLNAFLNERGHVEIKEVSSLGKLSTEGSTSGTTSERVLSNELHKKLSLRSHPLSLAQRSPSQDETHTDTIPVSETSLHQERHSPSPKLKKDDASPQLNFEPRDKRIVRLKERVKRDEEDTKKAESTTECASLERDSSKNIAARIDKIARLLIRKDETMLPESSIQSSKSATLSIKRRENLNLLKMKQKERRTHSANAVLQRQESGSIPFTLRFAEKNESLPSIHTGAKQGQLLDAVHPLKKAPTQGQRLHSRRFNRRRKEVQTEEQGEDGKTRIPDIPLLRIEDGGYESPGCVSIPASTISCTRPATYASGISSSPKTTICDITTTEPFIDAEAVALSAIERLRTANNARKKEMDWLSQAEALNDARRLVYHHPQVVRKLMRDFVLAFVPALQQLRSTTSRTAITLCQELFEHLGEAMDHDLDEVVPLLLKKAGETSNAGRDTFLASEADKALSIMVRTVTITRALHCLLQNANNSSKYIRSKVAAHLDSCLSHVTTTKLKASSNLALVDRIFKVCVAFLEEGYQQTRIYGKRILWALKRWIDSKGAYERLIGQVEPDSKRRRVLEVTQENEGPPPLPLRTTLSQSRRRLSGSSLTPLTPSLIPPSLASRVNTSTSPKSRLVDHEMEEIKSPHGWKSFQENYQIAASKTQRPPKPMHQKTGNVSNNSSTSLQEHAQSMTEVLSKLNAKDWRDRITALEQLRSFTGRLQHFKEKEVLNIIDQLSYRLNDGNSKVVLVTLETLKSVFEHVGLDAVPCTNTVLPAIVSSLASSLEKIRSAAEEVLDHLVEVSDGAHLVQSLSYCCGHGNQRTKAFLIQKLQHLTNGVYATKPQLVVKYILPVAFSALGDVRIDVREANAELLRELAQVVGDPFLEKAESLTGANRQRLFDILHGSF